MSDGLSANVASNAIGVRSFGCANAQFEGKFSVIAGRVT